MTWPRYLLGVRPRPGYRGDWRAAVRDRLAAQGATPFDVDDQLVDVAGDPMGVYRFVELDELIPTAPCGCGGSTARASAPMRSAPCSTTTPRRCRRRCDADRSQRRRGSTGCADRFTGVGAQLASNARRCTRMTARTGITATRHIRIATARYLELQTSVREMWSATHQSRASRSNCFEWLAKAQRLHRSSTATINQRSSSP